MLGVETVQLLPGRDICQKSFLAPINSLIFEYAYQMKNFIYLIGNTRSKQCVVIDAVRMREGGGEGGLYVDFKLVALSICL